MDLYLVFQPFVFTNNNRVQMPLYKYTNKSIGYIPEVELVPQGVCTFVMLIDVVKLLFS